MTRRRAFRALVLGVLAVPIRLRAQSTDRLPEFAPRIQYEAAGAVQSPFLSSYGHQTGALRAGSVGVLIRSSSAALVRIDGWLIERRPGPNDEARTYYLRPLDESRAVLTEVAVVFPLKLWDGVYLESATGIGVVPWARGTFIPYSGGAPINQTAAGWATTVGLSLRAGHLVIQQHVIQIMGADGALLNGETSALSVGLRFGFR